MKKILAFIKVNATAVLAVLSLVLLSLLVMDSRCTDNTDINKNLIIVRDSVKYERNRANELYATVQTHIVSEAQLKKINSDLYNEVQKFKKQKPIVITDVKYKIQYKDTAMISSIKEYLDKDGNKTFRVYWSGDTLFSKGNFISINGSTYVKIDSALNKIGYGSSLDSLTMGANLYLSLTEEKNGELRINARTDYPGLKFTEMEGYIVDPSKIKQFKSLFPQKRFGISTFMGAAATVNGGVVSIKPAIGVGVTYNIINF